MSCEVCKGTEHNIVKCEKFLKLHENERIAEVKKLKLCINCLRKGHFSISCRSGNCRYFSKRHNTPETSAISVSSSMSSNNVLLSTVTLKIVSESGKTQTIMAFFDAGSQSSFMTTALLNLKTFDTNITVGVFNNNNNICRGCKVKISSNNKQFQTNL